MFMCASAWEKIPEKVRRPSLLLQILHLYLRRNGKFLRCFKESSQHSVISIQPANVLSADQQQRFSILTFGNLSRLSRLAVDRAVDSGAFRNSLLYSIQTMKYDEDLLPFEVGFDIGHPEV